MAQPRPVPLPPPRYFRRKRPAALSNVFEWFYEWNGQTFGPYPKKVDAVRNYETMRRPPKKVEPARWGLAQADVMRLGDQRVLQLLRDAFDDVNRQIARLLPERGIGAQVRASQLQMVRKTLLEEQREIFARLGDEVRVLRLEAALRAAEVGSAVDSVLFHAAGRMAQAVALAGNMQKGLQRTLDNAVARMDGRSHVPLSARIYKTSVWMDGRLERQINSALARGLSPREFAAEARDWFNPDTPGGVRYASMRLARSELNNAFHAVAKANAEDKPWVTGMKWHLSRSHRRADECDALAHGGASGSGVYQARDIPRKPHPQCMCFVTPVVLDEEEFLDALVDGEFDDYLNRELDGTPFTPRKAATPRQRRVQRQEEARLVQAPEPPSLATPDAEGAPFSIRPSLRDAKDLGGIEQAFIAEAQRITGRYIPTRLRQPHIRESMGVSTAREQMEGLLRGLESFPTANLRSVTIFRGDPSIYAHVLNSGSDMEFNVAFYASGARERLRRSIKGDDTPRRFDYTRTGPEAYKPGWHVRNSGDRLDSVALHEFGHIVHFGESNWWLLEHRIEAQLRQWGLDRGMTYKQVGAEISGYADKNTTELIAEALTDVWINGPKAAEPSKIVFNALREHHEQNPKGR